MEDLSEKEQLDQIRFWWSKYGTYILGGIVLGVSLLVGFNYFQNQTMQSQLEASAIYEKLIQQVSDNNLEDAQQTANEMHASYENTVYATQAYLAMARLYMDQNRDTDAADSLKKILNSGAESEFKDIARLRLARIYLYQEKPEEVINLLSSYVSGSFAISYGEVLGDAYAMLGKISDAESVYERVLMDPRAQSSVDIEYVRWKALDLPKLKVNSEDVNKVINTMESNDNNEDLEVAK